MRYFIDVDGVICTNTDGDYHEAQPFTETIRKINNLYAEGHHITIWTARGTTTGRDWRQLTEHQLNAWGVLYHVLMMGKPHYDKFVDDKATSAL